MLPRWWRRSPPKRTWETASRYLCCCQVYPVHKCVLSTTWSGFAKTSCCVFVFSSCVNWDGPTVLRSVRTGFLSCILQTTRPSRSKHEHAWAAWPYLLSGFCFFSFAADYPAVNICLFFFWHIQNFIMRWRVCSSCSQTGQSFPTAHWPCQWF